MSLLDNLTAWCAEQFYECGDCQHCTHPSGQCSGSCLKCSEDLNYHRFNGRKDYDCQKLIYYYTCRYSWKYCSEILYALENVNLSVYPAYNILSIGCGCAPDLMAFEENMAVGNAKHIFYEGVDISPCWTPIHTTIQQYTSSTRHIDAEFVNNDIFDALAHNGLRTRNYNVIILEYLLSHFPPAQRAVMADTLFDGLLQTVLPNRLPDSPVLILINDIDHFDVRNCFDLLLQKLIALGTHGSCLRRHFNSRAKDYGDESIQYSSRNNKFFIPEKMKSDFNCAIKCSGAQLIAEVT